MDIIVIADTNCVHDARSFDYLLGNRDILEKITKFATLILPTVVIEEIINQKHDYFEKKRDELRNNNVLLSYTTVTDDDLLKLSFQSVEEKLRADQSIPFKTIGLSDKAKALETTWELALHHKAPFEQNNDKGFKDALIAMEIKNYLKTDSVPEKVFLFSNDRRFCEYFYDDSRIIPVEKYEDIEESLKIDAVPKENDLVTSATEGKPITSTSFKQNGNMFIEGPSKKQKEVRDLLTHFRNSASFSETHSLVKKLQQNNDSLSDEDYRDLLLSTTSNNQIWKILDDPDVQAFMIPIFEKYASTLDQEQYNIFISHAGLTDCYGYQDGSPVFTDSDIHTYRSFSFELWHHISSIEKTARLSFSPETVLPQLQTIFKSNQLESSLPDCKCLINVFISGEYDYEPEGFSLNTLHEFLQLLESASPEKRDIILLNIRSKLQSIYTYDKDIPF